MNNSLRKKRLLQWRESSDLMMGLITRLSNRQGVQAGVEDSCRVINLGKWLPICWPTLGSSKRTTQEIQIRTLPAVSPPCTRLVVHFSCAKSEAEETQERQADRGPTRNC